MTRRCVGAATAALALLASAARALERPGATPDHLRSADVVLDVPYVPQTELMCGAAALSMLLRYWGDDGAAPEQYRDLVSGARGGITTADLARAAGAGWRSIAFATDLPELERQLERGRPIVTLIEVARDRYHYVTVVGRVGGSVVFHDPAVSPYRRLPAPEFDRLWSKSGRWALLVLPRSAVGEAAVESAPDGPGEGSGVPPASPGGADIRSVATRAPDSVAPADRGCAAAVSDAIASARAGRPERASRLLHEADAGCPDDAAVQRELAALHLMSGQADSAVRRARRALELDPSDGHAADILAAGLYVGGREEEALDAWARSGPFEIAEVTLGAPGRTRQQVILGLAGLAEGHPLSAASFRRSRRRLGLLPAAAATRLSYAPIGGGRQVSVTVAVAERPVLPSPATLLAEGALALFTDHGLRFHSASPTGGGELWTLQWRWREERRLLRAALARPVAHPVVGLLGIEGERGRETYAFGTTPAEERRRVGATFDTWVAADVGIGLGVAAEHWDAIGTVAALGARLRVASPGDALLLVLAADVRLGGSRALGRGAIDVTWRSGTEPEGIVTSIRLGAAGVSAGAPRMLWPGAGIGSARLALARAHPLLSDGRIAGPLFGRLLFDAGVESVWWHHLGPARLGLAAFVDGAASARRQADAPSGAVQVDAGTGLRVALPRESVLRLDIGIGLRDAAAAVSLALETRGPR